MQNALDLNIINLQNSSFFFKDSAIKALKMLHNEIEPITYPISWSTFTATKLNGQLQMKRGNIIVRINRLLIKEEDVLNTIIHELLHSYPQCRKAGHKGQWLLMANKVKQKFNINITRINAKEKNLEGLTPKYIIKCTGCGKESPLYRKLKYPINCYKCARCHSNVQYKEQEIL